MVHTGAKIQFGGENDGRTNVAYHVPIDGVVKIEPIAPASSQMIIAKTSLAIFEVFISAYYNIERGSVTISVSF
jgi:hypothetical protein